MGVGGRYTDRDIHAHTYLLAGRFGRQFSASSRIPPFLHSLLSHTRLTQGFFPEEGREKLRSEEESEETKRYRHTDKHTARQTHLGAISLFSNASLPAQLVLALKVKFFCGTKWSELNFLLIFRAHMNILFRIEMRKLVLTKWSLIVRTWIILNLISFYFEVHYDCVRLPHKDVHFTCNSWAQR